MWPIGKENRIVAFDPLPSGKPVRAGDNYKLSRASLYCNGFFGCSALFDSNLLAIDTSMNYYRITGCQLRDSLPDGTYLTVGIDVRQILLSDVQDFAFCGSAQKLISTYTRLQKL